MADSEKNQNIQDDEAASAEPVQRLCSEIQLFDLCELDSCRSRQGRFCTNQELLSRFEAIAEDDAAQHRAGEDGDEPDEDEDGRLMYCDDIVDADYGDDEGWDDE